MPAPTPPDVSPVHPPRAGLLGRVLLAFFLFLWIAFVGVSAYQWIRYTPPDDTPPAVRVGLSLFFLAGPVWVLARRLRGLRNPLPASITASAALTAGVAVFLAWLAHDDETWRHSERHPALRNDFPGAAATHALTLRYSEEPRGALYHTLPATKLVFPKTERGKDNDAKWTEFLAKNGPAIDQLWTDSATLRAWIGELADAPAIGDLTEDFRSPLISFKALRQAGQISCARALQLAADGRRDEAVDVVLPVYIAAQKLELHARTLVRRMISIMLRRQAQNTIGRILDAGELSPATRARLADALAPRSDVAEQARLLARSEYEIFGRMVLSLRPEDADLIARETPSAPYLIRFVLRPLHPLVFNPRLTANLAGDHFDQVGEAGAKRDLNTIETLGADRFTGPGTKLPGKNYAGRLLMAMAIPTMGKVTETYWKADDERAAVLARLHDQAGSQASAF